MPLRAWLRLTFEPPLLMSFLLVTLGTAVAWRQGHFNLFHYLLTVLGTVLVQNAVNVLNEYYDYMSGVDLRSIKTPFSGGSKLIVKEMLEPRNVRLYGLLCFSLAAAIGVYFLFASGLLLLPLLLVSGISVYFYTSFFARHYMGELLAGLNLGPLTALGTYFVQTSAYSWEAFTASLAPGLMISNVLLLNEFPDMEADASGGRRNAVTFLGRRRAARLYAGLEALAYVWMAASMLIRWIPFQGALALFSLPFALKAISGALKDYEDPVRMVPNLGMNIVAAFSTIALLTVGFLVSSPP